VIWFLNVVLSFSRAPIYRIGVQPDVPHAHAQRQEAIHMSRLRQRVLPELRPQETLAQTPRRPLSAAPAGSGRAASHCSRADGATAFAAAAAEHPPRPRHVRATVPAGPGRIPQERDHVTQLAAPLLIPDGGWLGEAVVRRANFYLYNNNIIAYTKYLYVLRVTRPKTVMIILYDNVYYYYYGYLYR